MMDDDEREVEREEIGVRKYLCPEVTRGCHARILYRLLPVHLSHRVIRKTVKDNERPVEIRYQI
jgi:hypothetical protein